MSTVKSLVVADDLSGASDTGHQFAARGYGTRVAAAQDATPADESVLVVNTDSRYSAQADAAERVANAVDRVPADVVYKKIDSTLRGNLVAEIDAMVEATGADLAVVAPAFPSTGRMTVGGTHLVDGTPVARTAAGEDPDTPVEHSHVPQLLADSSFAVDALSIETVAEGATAVGERLAGIAAADGPALVVCDAATETHLAAIADGSAALDASTVFVGSGGLARHVRLDAAGASGVLGVAGSASPVTFEQLSTLPAECVVAVDGERAVTDPDAVVETVSERASAVLADRSQAIITAAQAPEDVEATVAAGAAAGLSEAETRDRIAAVLGRCADVVYRTHGFAGLFVTGGAVATTVLDALDGEGISLTGHAVDDGVPLGRIHGGVADGVPLVTKAGAFGTSDTIVKSLDYLSQYDDGS